MDIAKMVHLSKQNSIVSLGSKSQDRDMDGESMVNIIHFDDETQRGSPKQGNNRHKVQKKD